MKTFAALLGMILLSACVGETNGDAVGGGSGLPSLGKACTDVFNPAKAAAGEDCTPDYYRYCPSPGLTNPGNHSEVTPCQGVNVSSGAVTVDGVTSRYVILTPVTGGRSGMYVALHWITGNGETMASRMRLTELARGRDVTVILPTAPGIPSTWGFDLLPTLTEVTTRLQLLDAMVAIARERTGYQGKLWMAGLSGGGVMAYEYACARADQVAGVEMVAAEVQTSNLNNCAPSQPFVSVQVHGTLDLIAPYMMVPLRSAGQLNIFNKALGINGCDENLVSTANMPSLDTLTTGVEVRFAPPSTCSSGLGAALVTIEGGGHNWPGYDDPLGLGLGVNGYGPTTNSFDATLQGYDLMRYLAGY